MSNSHRGLWNASCIRYVLLSTVRTNIRLAVRFTTGNLYVHDECALNAVSSHRRTHQTLIWWDVTSNILILDMAIYRVPGCRDVLNTRTRNGVAVQKTGGLTRESKLIQTFLTWLTAFGLRMVVLLAIIVITSCCYSLAVPPWYWNSVSTWQFAWHNEPSWRNLSPNIEHRVVTHICPYIHLPANVARTCNHALWTGYG